MFRGLLIVALLLLAACQGPGLRRLERRLDALGNSLARVAPDRLARGWSERLRHATTRVPEVALDDDPRQLAASAGKALVAATREIGRTATAAGDAAALVGDTVCRLENLPDPPATWRVLGPGRAAARLRHIADRWPQLLRLDQAVLPEPTDARHRTDPRDVRPQATWLERILRRLGI